MTNWTTLPFENLRAYQAARALVVLVREARISIPHLHDQAMRAALQPLVGSIDVELMRAANLRATGGSNASPAEVARWLWGEIERRR